MGEHLSEVPKLFQAISIWPKTQGVYTLNEGKETIVYAATICFICSGFAIKQINGKDGFYISEKQHLNILDALDL